MNLAEEAEMRLFILGMSGSFPRGEHAARNCDCRQRGRGDAHTEPLGRGSSQLCLANSFWAGFTHVAAFTLEKPDPHNLQQKSTNGSEKVRDSPQQVLPEAAAWCPVFSC